MQPSIESKKWVITPSFFLCQLLIITLFLPERGSILGVRYSILLIICCFFQFLIAKQKSVKIPLYYWVYTLIEIFLVIIHFEDRTIFYHVIAILQIIGSTYVILKGIRTERQFNQFLNFILIAFSIYAVLGIIESVFHINIFDILTGTTVEYVYANELRFGFARTRGALNVSINNGMLLCLVLCIAAYCIINAPRNRKLKYKIAYSLIFLDCFLTLSRAVWIDIFLSQILIFISLSSKKKMVSLFKFIIGIIILLIIGSLISPKLVSSIANILNEMIGSIINVLGGSTTSEMQGEGDRLKLWVWVWNMVQNNLIVGVGYAQKFVYRISSFATKESIEVMWLYKLYRTGFVGLVGYIFFQFGDIIYLIKQWIRERRFRKKEKRVSFNYIVLIASITYFITQFSCSSFEDLRFFYIFISMTFVYNNIFNKRKKGV